MLFVSKNQDPFIWLIASVFLYQSGKNGMAIREENIGIHMKINAD